MLNKLELPQHEAITAAKVEVFLSPEWSSEQSQNRQQIRTAVEEQLRLQWADKVSSTELQTLKDLDQVPKFSHAHVSISHAADLGGFAVSQSPIGFDIEVIERVKDVIVRRISLEAEMINAPTPAHLWAAKEAAYKALRAYSQPGVISDLEIGAWEGGNFHLLNAERFGAPKGVGFCWADREHVFSLFVF